ncbi:hypothetical protein AB0C02_17600 [Micromonospora sp. NPDC048999]|uniref:hypothetical protein n=1 Tax=Micromonospora sp. NPDC048999 TaxID=3155391 RepID=UPI0033E6A033
MTDLDQRIASVLRERAEGEIDTRRLLRVSRAQGRRRQLRRRAATGTALTLAGILGLVGVTGTDFTGLPGRLPWIATTPTVAPPVPPRADGVPGAAQRPDLVGGDPRVLHLGLDTSRARYLGWNIYGWTQTESIRFSVGGGQPVVVEVSRSAQRLNDAAIDGPGSQRITVPPLAFDGGVQPLGTTGGLAKGWQPVPGVYARVTMLVGDRAALERAVDVLRWDEARRCEAPLRLTTLPKDATLTDCDVDVSAVPNGLRAQYTIGRGESAAMYVRLMYGAQIAGSRSDGNRTVDGRPAYLSPDGATLELLDIPKAHLVAAFGWLWPGIDPAKGYVSFTEADATTVLAGAQVPKDLSDPETWD